MDWSEENSAAVLRLLLDVHAMTQVGLAEASGVPQSTISAYLKGHRPIPRRKFEKLASAFNLDGGIFLTSVEYVAEVYGPEVKEINRFRQSRLEKARAKLLVMSNRTRQKATKDALTSDTPRSENHPAVRSSRAAISPAA